MKVCPYCNGMGGYHDTGCPRYDPEEDRKFKKLMCDMNDIFGKFKKDEDLIENNNIEDVNEN